MTYVSVSDCRLSYLSVTDCSAVLEPVNYMTFSQLLWLSQMHVVTLSHVTNCVISWIINFKVWLKLPSGPSVCTPVTFIKTVLVLRTARKFLESILYPIGTERFVWSRRHLEFAVGHLLRKSKTRSGFYRTSSVIKTSP